MLPCHTHTHTHLKLPPQCWKERDEERESLGKGKWTPCLRKALWVLVQSTLALISGIILIGLQRRLHTWSNRKKARRLLETSFTENREKWQSILRGKQEESLKSRATFKKQVTVSGCQHWGEFSTQHGKNESEEKWVPRGLNFTYKDSTPKQSLVSLGALPGLPLCLGRWLPIGQEGYA
jgi:hypothetical protein